jgi:MFS transporter, DHA1 family, arabinose polymer utilization protein
MFAGLTVANLLSVPLGTYIGHHYSWRYTFGLIAAIGLLALVALQFLMPPLEAGKAKSIREELVFFKTAEAWLILLITAIGTGGLFCWISYIAPLMTEVSNFSKETVPYILIIAGFGMVVGNFFGGRLADVLPPVKACLALLLAMTVALIIIYFFSANKATSLIMTFVAGGLSMALGSPIQILMIKTAKGAEMLGAAATQAAFNTGNALGAFLGGLPIAFGFGFPSADLVGAAMAATGSIFALILYRRQQSYVTKPAL